MSSFVDHLQIIPIPFKGRERQPDGANRPGGLGTLTLSDRLEERGWTPRAEDLTFDHDLPELRLAEAFARSIGDAVLSAWDRQRFPIVLTRTSWGALGVGDGFGPEIGVIWISPFGDYQSGGLLRRAAIDRMALAMATGRGKRDKFAMDPQQIPGPQVIHLGGQLMEDDERRDLKNDGIRILDSTHLGELASVVASADVDRWFIHIDLRALAGDTVPGADLTVAEGLDPKALASALEDAMTDVSIATVMFSNYDLNEDSGETTLATLTELAETVIKVTGGVPRPGVVENQSPA